MNSKSDNKGNKNHVPIMFLKYKSLRYAVVFPAQSCNEFMGWESLMSLRGYKDRLNMERMTAVEAVVPPCEECPEAGVWRRLAGRGCRGCDGEARTS